MLHHTSEQIFNLTPNTSLIPNLTIKENPWNSLAPFLMLPKYQMIRTLKEGKIDLDYIYICFPTNMTDSLIPNLIFLTHFSLANLLIWAFYYKSFFWSFALLPICIFNIDRYFFMYLLIHLRVKNLVDSPLYYIELSNPVYYN